jgi:hypothetical protein
VVRLLVGRPRAGYGYAGFLKMGVEPNVLGTVFSYMEFDGGGEGLNNLSGVVYIGLKIEKKKETILKQFVLCLWM